MVKRIISVGMILLLCSACLPHLGSLSEKSQNAGRESSLFTPSELERLFSNDPASSRHKTLALSSVSSGDGVVSAGIERPINDEANDDFDLEVLPSDQQPKELDFDIPIVINAQVEHFIQYFQTTLKSRFSSWLARSEKYIPFMKTVLKENGLPEDLVYMALIESGFNPYAYSRSKASGPWQFIYLTGKRYGLAANWWVDERRDPEKSTVAAAKYLKDLYDMFECWYLAAAGYNAGENKIVNAIKRYRTEDFWELTKYQYLKQETKDYVPQMIAAALIAKAPESYGFDDIEYQEPLRYEKARVPGLTDLSAVAKACEISLEELKDLNPELLRGCTPPNSPDYEVKIPLGKKELFLRNFEALSSIARFQFKIHKVRKGDTPQKIARLYRVDLDPFLEMNSLSKTSRLPKGASLLLPVSGQRDWKPAPAPPKKPDTETQPPKSEEIFYTIKKGDSLWSIANEMGINIGVISRWNNLHPEKKLIPGDKLRIRMISKGEPGPGEKNQKKEPGKEKEIVYVVKAGDTLWGIAKKHDVRVAEIKSWNNLSRTSQIRPSSRLKLRIKSAI